ncbi:MAG: hypothetical protein EBR92_10640, partial [Alphaproteobacteria bacterium]|nr:hypothetical protein [Alphaproteobacteria bacterium]
MPKITDHRLELEHGVVALGDLLRVAELAVLIIVIRRRRSDLVAGQNIRCRRQVQLRDLPTSLRGEHHRRQEDTVLVQERVETSRQLAFEVLMPAVEDIVDRIVRAHG